MAVKNTNRLLCLEVQRTHVIERHRLTRQDILTWNIYQLFHRRMLDIRQCTVYLVEQAMYHQVGYNHLISNKRKWNNCFIISNQEILISLCKKNQKTINYFNGHWLFLWHHIIAHKPMPLSQSNS